MVMKKASREREERERERVRGKQRKKESTLRYCVLLKKQTKIETKRVGERGRERN